MRLYELSYISINKLSRSDFYEEEAEVIINLDHIVSINGILELTSRLRSMELYYAELTLSNDDVYYISEREYKRLMTTLYKL